MQKNNQQQLNDQTNIYKTIEVLTKNKAEDIVLLDLKEIHSYLSSFLICTALSKTHLRKLNSELNQYFKNNDLAVSCLAHEKEFESGWIVLDTGIFTVHIFLKETREFYELEKLWQQARKIDISKINISKSIE